MSNDRADIPVSQRSIWILRGSVSLGGAALVTVALLADRWGYGSAGSLGLG
jgi:hypothetical protein